MRQAIDSIRISTHGPGLYEITNEVVALCRGTGIESGLLTLFIQHTSASLLIQENADPDVQTDLHAFFRRLVPEGDPLFIHTCEGPDDMPAHVKAALTQTSLSIPIGGNRPVLGTWQGIYLFEHRQRAHDRRIVIHVIGTP